MPGESDRPAQPVAVPDSPPERFTLKRGVVSIEIGGSPAQLRVLRAGRPILGPLTPWAAAGRGSDRLIRLTEGVLPDEMMSRHEPMPEARIEPIDSATVRLRGRGGSRAFSAMVSLPGPERMLLELEADGAPFRLGASWDRPRDSRLTGLGARHATRFDQGGRELQLGADRRYTGPDCPPDMLDVGGIPQGDYAPAPWLVSSGGWSVWVETAGPGCRFELGNPVGVSVRAASGPLRLHLLTDPTPAARLRRYCSLTGFPALLPEWAYGHWKSRDVYEHQSDVIEDFQGYRRHDIPLDAIVIDSPWETQYNTWEFNPHQFPDPEEMIRRMRSAGVRTVVWITPWVNLESKEGQRAPGPESERLAARPASNYAHGERAGHYVRGADGAAYVGRWWMGTGSLVDFTSPAAERWWRGLAQDVLALGVEGIKADDGEGYYIPPDARFANGRSGAEAAWAYGGLYRRSMQRALDHVHPGEGVLFGRSGWSGQQATGILWGGDQASDFWSLRALVTAILTAAVSGYSNTSHDVGGYLGWRLVERCPAELLARWAQFGCFTPLMQAHGRFRQEAWTYGERTAAIFREFVLLHERLVPYVRAAAATANRAGLPIVRPLCLIDPGDPRGWEIADAYGYGPALWVAPVLEQGARERTAYLPRGEWIDWWTGERLSGGREVTVPAPLERIPVWVRAGAIVVTYPPGHVVEGLGDTPERDRPLEATLWGEPPLGRASVRLADGTRIRWTRGKWSSTPPRRVRFQTR